MEAAAAGRRCDGSGGALKSAAIIRAVNSHSPTGWYRSDGGGREMDGAAGRAELGPTTTRLRRFI